MYFFTNEQKTRERNTALMHDNVARYIPSFNRINSGKVRVVGLKSVLLSPLCYNSQTAKTTAIWTTVITEVKHLSCCATDSSNLKE